MYTCEQHCSWWQKLYKLTYLCLTPSLILVAYPILLVLLVYQLIINENISNQRKPYQVLSTCTQNLLYACNIKKCCINLISTAPLNSSAFSATHHVLHSPGFEAQHSNFLAHQDNLVFFWLRPLKLLCEILVKSVFQAFAYPWHHWLS